MSANIPNLNDSIDWYNKMGKKVWDVKGSLASFIDDLIEFRKETIAKDDEAFVRSLCPELYISGTGYICLRAASLGAPQVLGQTWKEARAWIESELTPPWSAIAK